jgi:hypothetical protein
MPLPLLNPELFYLPPASAAVAEVLARAPRAPEVCELLLSGWARPRQQHGRHHTLHRVLQWKHHSGAA